MSTGHPSIPPLAAIRSALEAIGGGPKKSFGQHFLSDPAMLRRIVEFADVSDGDVVLEVGPGPGVLTAALLERGAQVVAVEADRQMIELHHALIGEHSALEILAEDVLCERPAPSQRVRDRLTARGGPRPYAFVANLPYSIASPLLVDVFEAFPPRVAVVMVQREVAQRMRAAPGSPEYGLLSVLIQLRATVEECMRLRPGAFWPPPKVDSAVLRIVPRRDSTAGSVAVEALHDTVRRAFLERRKKLRNTLLRGSPLAAPELDATLIQNGFDPEIRAEQMPPEAFVRLAVALSSVEQRRAGAHDDPQRKHSGHLPNPPRSL